MLPAGRHNPLLRRDDVGLRMQVAALTSVEHAAPVDPSSEVGRHGDVGRRCDDTVGQLRVLACDIRQEAAEALLRREIGARRRVELRRNRNPRRAMDALRRLVEWNGCEKRRELVGRDIEAGAPIPFLAFANVHLAPERRDLLR